MRQINTNEYQKQFATHPLVLNFAEHIEKLERPNDVIALLSAFRHVAIQWFKSRGESERAIGIHLGVSNTRIAQIRQQYEGVSK